MQIKFQSFQQCKIYWNPQHLNFSPQKGGEKLQNFKITFRVEEITQARKRPYDT